MLYSNSIFSQEQEAIDYVFTTKTKLLEKMNDSTNVDYHLVYVYAPWCKPCKKHLPKLLTYLESHPNIKLYLVDYDNASSIYSPEHKYLKSTGFTGTVYKIALSYYDKKPYTRHAEKRYAAFLKEIVGRETGKGLSKYLLFDKKLELVYVSETGDEKLSILDGFASSDKKKK